MTDAEPSLMVRAWELLNQLMPEIRYVPFDSYEQFAEEVLNHPQFDPNGFYIALLDGEVIGVCGVLSDRDLLPMESLEDMPAYLYLLFVEPQHRCEGVGTLLLSEAEKYAASRGNRGLRVSHKCPIKFVWRLSSFDAQHNKAPGILAGSAGDIFLQNRGFEVEATEVSYHLDLTTYSLTSEMLEERKGLERMGYTIGYFDAVRHSGQEEMFTRLKDESYRRKFKIALKEGAEILVALHDDSTVCGIAGSLTVEPSGRGSFQGLAIDPAHTGKKLGNALFFKLCEELKEKEARYMTFFVDDDNYARKIYERAGGTAADVWNVLGKKGGIDHE